MKEQQSLANIKKPEKNGRVIVEDQLFGKLSYHKSFINNVEFDKNKYLCNKPFMYAEIQKDGRVYICCTNWNPVIIGNIFESSIAEIWNGEKAKTVRETITNGSYKYCNASTCEFIKNKNLLENTEENLKKIEYYGDLKTPTVVRFKIDDSCNLTCPSCRLEKLAQMTPIDKKLAYKNITSILDCMFSHPHQENKFIGMDFSGEIFSSEVYRHIFDNHPVFTRTDDWPNLRFHIITNGTMMTEKIQKKYENIFKHLEMIEISIDAGNKESYEKVRVGGHWDLLWKNLKYLYDTTIKTSTNIRWQWNIVMQKHNYQSLPELVNIANTFDIIPRINVTDILNWGHLTEEQYLDCAVHISTHEEHENYKKIMSWFKNK